MMALGNAFVATQPFVFLDVFKARETFVLEEDKEFEVCTYHTRLSAVIFTRFIKRPAMQLFGLIVAVWNLDSQVLWIERHFWNSGKLSQVAYWRECHGKIALQLGEVF